jgi:hypothetical protein
VSRSDATLRSADNTSLNVVDDDAESVVDKIHYLISQHLVEENDLECKSEVDRYLLDGCEATTKDFNVLGWWKIKFFFFFISTVYFKKAQRGATQSTQDVCMIPLIQRERRKQVKKIRKRTIRHRM